MERSQLFSFSCSVGSLLSACFIELLETMLIHQEKDLKILIMIFPNTSSTLGVCQLEVAKSQTIPFGLDSKEKLLVLRMSMKTMKQDQVHSLWY